MKTKPLIQFAAFVLLATLNQQVSTSFAQGSLTPPGAPAASMKSLAQIEPRTPIASAPFTISLPGSYYLTTNLSVNVSNAISIAVSGVTLDLNGFTISSTTPTPAGAGVLIAGSISNITVFNGNIASGVTEVGGVYGGHGFDGGIEFVLNLSNPTTFGQPYNVRVSRVSVSGCMTYGIFIGALSTLVDSCAVRTIGSYGIEAGSVQSSEATDCGSDAIEGSQVFDSQGQCVGTGYGVFATYTAQNCFGFSTNSIGLYAPTAHNCNGVSATGTGIQAQQADTCYGASSGSGSYGVYADVAQNCSGFNYSGTGIGLRTAYSAINCHGQGGSQGLAADGVAQNCYGRCNTNGTGLIATCANNCFGYCPAGNTGIGLSAGQANNCYGQNDENGVGLSAGSAIGCFGKCYGSNVGISANILNSCTYYRQTGTPGFNGTKYNMP